MKDLLSVEMRAGVNNEWDQSLTTYLACNQSDASFCIKSLETNMKYALVFCWKKLLQLWAEI